MLFFNKLLPVFVLPTGVVGILLLVALWRRERWPIVLALLVLYFSSIPLVGNRLIGWVESRHPLLAIEQAESADAIIVLGGILGPRATPGQVANMMDSVERFEAGIRLHQAGRGSQLVFTGAKMGWKDTSATEGDELKRLAIERGVPADQILVTAHVANTADEARVVSELTRERGWNRVVLVTTGWHMARSAYQFQKAGVGCTPFPVDFRHDPARRISAIDFVPRGEAWMFTETALREIYGYWFYRLFR
jgi:uncharacterized SAM-binding protein YcdF (DUF218 family)